MRHSTFQPLHTLAELGMGALDLIPYELTNAVAARTLTLPSRNRADSDAMWANVDDYVGSKLLGGVAAMVGFVSVCSVTYVTTGYNGGLRPSEVVPQIGGVLAVGGVAEHMPWLLERVAPRLAPTHEL